MTDAPNFPLVLVHWEDATGGEEWRSVLGFPKYEVSNLGRVRSNYSKKPRILQPTFPSHEYPTVFLYRDKRAFQHTVHRLVCEVFHGPPPTARSQVAHGNGDRSDSRASNLRWATQSENERDKRLHGRAQIGEGNGAAKLTASDVAEIKRRALAGESRRAIAAAYGVSAGNVWLIKKGLAWKHLQEPAA